MDKKAENATSSDVSNIRHMKQRLSNRRWLIERNWWGSLLFYLGQQWIVYDNNSRRWKQRRISPSVPTPITNYFRSTIDTVKSAIAQHEPRYVGVPTRDDARAVAAASSTDAQLQIILKEGRFERARARALDWMMLTGNSFMETVWDNSDDTGLQPVPKEICLNCGKMYSAVDLDPEVPTCPKDGGMLVESATEYEWIPRGEIRFDVFSPFEIFLDPVIEDLEEQPFIIVAQSFTEEQIKARWNVDAKGGLATATEGSSLLNKDSIAAIMPGVTPGSPYSMSAGGDMMTKRVVVYRAFIKNHPEYPKGAYIAMTTNGVLLEKKDEYPWRRGNGLGRKYYPITHFKFGTVPGRAWGFSPADDLLPKQYQLNKAESLMTMIMSRMANPVWMIPAMSNPSRITGDVGVQIEYTPVGGAKPERMGGVEAPQSLVKYIQDIRQSFDELSGAFAAIRGRPMGSRTPVGTVQQLNQAGFGRWATVFNQLELGYQEIAVKSLETWRQNAHTPRVQAIKDQVGGYTFKEFQGADWDDGVEVEVEAGSTRPHNQQEKMQMYMQLAQVGVLDFMDEAQKVKMLEDLGMINMKPGVEEDTKHAYKENQQFMEWARQGMEQLSMVQDPMMKQMMAQQMSAQAPMMVIPIVDDHAVHFLTHRRLAMTDDFKTLPPEFQNMWYMHMMQHKMDILGSKILNMPMNPQGAGSPAAMQGGGPGGGGGLPPQGRNAEAQKGQGGTGRPPGSGKPGSSPGGGSAHAASTKEMQGGQSNPNHNT